MSKSEAASIAISSKSEDVSIGKSYNFNIKNKVKGSTYKWSTSDKSIATVNSKNGVAKGVKVGTATISCKITLPNKTTKTVKATLNVRPDATAVAISNPVTKMDLGSSHDFNRTMTPANSANKTYWIVKDAAGKEVANTRTGVGASIMSSKGVFTPAAVGTYTITAECWRSKTASVKRAESSPLTVNVALKEITKLEVADVTLFTDTDGQTLKVIADGREVTGADLAAAGYSVTFNASESGLLSSTGTTNNTGVVTRQTAAKTYTYSVVAQKGSTIIESNKAKVTILDKATTAASSISSVKISSTGIDEIKSGKVIKDEAGLRFSEVIATLMDNRTNVDLIALNAPVTYETSDATVAVVDATGAITAKAPGRVTITIKSGNVSYPVSLEVVSAKRELTRITYTGNTVSLALGAKKTVSVVAYDQYGDTFNTATASIPAITYVNATANGSVIATAGTLTGATEVVDQQKGKASVEITADTTKAGSGSVAFYANSKHLGSIPVSVTKDTTGTTVKLELSSTTIDLSAKSTQKLITVALNKYVNGDSYLEPETIKAVEVVYPNGDTINYGTTSTITRERLINKNASATSVSIKNVADGVIGTYAVKVTYNDGTKDVVKNANFTVVNTAPVLSSVSLNKVNVNATGLTLADIVTSAIPSSYEYDGVVRYIVSGSRVYIYMDSNATVSGYNYADGDCLLGYIEATTLSQSATCTFTGGGAPYSADKIMVTLSGFTNGGKVQIDVKSINGTNLGRVVLSE